MMNAFVQLLLATSQVQSDVIGDLPAEIGSTILRHLDNESLLSAAQVNRRWKSICEGDPVLRHRIRKRLQEERKARLQAYLNPSAGVEVFRKNPAVMFGQRNGIVSTKTKAVKYEVPTNNIIPQMKKFKVRRMNKVHPMEGKKKKFDTNNNELCASRQVLRMFRI